MIDVLIPLMRPDHLPNLIENIEETTPQVHTNLIVANKDIPRPRGLSWDRWFTDSGNTYAKRINWVFSESGSDYAFLGSDDILFHSGWAGEAMKVMSRVDGVVGVNDLHNPHPTHFLVSRRYIETLGGTMDGSGLVLHPYQHNYVDLELVGTAKKRGRFAICEESIVEHCHPDAGKAEDDDVYRLGRSSYEADGQLFQSRRHLWES